MEMASCEASEVLTMPSADCDWDTEVFDGGACVAIGAPPAMMSTWEPHILTATATATAMDTARATPLRATPWSSTATSIAHAWR